jgi:hypothetical protein
MTYIPERREYYVLLRTVIWSLGSRGPNLKVLKFEITHFEKIQKKYWTYTMLYYILCKFYNEINCILESVKIINLDIMVSENDKQYSEN